MADNRTSSIEELLQTLSSKAPPTCHSEQIDFVKVGLPEYKGKFAILINDLFSQAECAGLLKAAEASQNGLWENAMVNVGNGRQQLMTDVRLCGRIIWDTPEVVDALLRRIKPHLPAEIVSLKSAPGITGPGPQKRDEVLQMTRLNERLRFLKYTKGMYFREHCDGCYVTPDGTEVSFLTVHIYLNSQEAEGDEVLEDMREEEKPLKGGATRFFGSKGQAFDVNPARGACLVFQHRGLYHSGEEVDQGTKYTVRTDIMYQKAK